MGKDWKLLVSRSTGSRVPYTIPLKGISWKILHICATGKEAIRRWRRLFKWRVLPRSFFWMVLVVSLSGVMIWRRLLLHWSVWLLLIRRVLRLIDVNRPTANSYLFLGLSNLKKDSVGLPTLSLSL